MINQLKDENAKKKKSLLSYESLLKQPPKLDGAHADEGELAPKCVVCGKMFAGVEYLISHYKKRHLDYYIAEVRPREDEMLKSDLRDIVKDLSKKSSAD